MTQAAAPPANTTKKQEQLAAFADSIRKIRDTGTTPVIDFEFHYGGMDTEKILDNMRRNGVALTLLGPNEKQGSEESLRLNNLYPDKFVPTTVHGDGPLWHGNDTGFIKKLDSDVRSGNYFAMGEFEARHYPSNTNNRDVHKPLDSPDFVVIFKASGDTDIPFLIHHEAEDAMLPELEHMLTKYPKAKVIWCHFGRNRNPLTWTRFTTPDTAREYLKNYPNLYFDLVQSPPGSKYQTGYPDGIMYDTSRNPAVLKPEWKAVIEDYPDRFVLGTDINGGRFDSYDQVIKIFRQNILPGLSKETAEKVAYKNAWKLMTGQDWKE
ncbi:MAG: amidohydrolase family protein [Methanoregula sp.]